MEKDLNFYIDVIKNGLNNVEKNYYQINIACESASIIRERVFCYELYHQIRKIIEMKKISFSLNGEIDKRGHRKINESNRKNPDFVFHEPGTMDNNIMVIEVKGKIYYNKCLDDFDKLVCFVEKYNYKLGIFILYNHSFSELYKKIANDLKSKFKSKEKEMLENVIILCKKDFKSDIEQHTLKKIVFEDD